MASRPSEEEALSEFLDSASTAPSALLVDGEAGIRKLGIRSRAELGQRVVKTAT